MLKHFRQKTVENVKIRNFFNRMCKKVRYKDIVCKLWQHFNYCILSLFFVIHMYFSAAHLLRNSELWQHLDPGWPKRVTILSSSPVLPILNMCPVLPILNMYYVFLLSKTCFISSIEVLYIISGKRFINSGQCSDDF